MGPVGRVPPTFEPVGTVPSNFWKLWGKQEPKMHSIWYQMLKIALASGAQTPMGELTTLPHIP